MAIRLQTCLQDFADQGITADQLTADELVALVHACERADNPYSDVNAELCGRPVEVCRGLYLWPITTGAQIWLTEYAETWWPRGSAMYRWAQVYALRNARDPDAFHDLVTKGVARLAVMRCMLRFCCHRAELAVAINRCYGLHYHDVEAKSSAPHNDEMADDLATLVATLEVQSGIRAEHWLWGRSLMYTAKEYKRARNLANALGGGPELTFELNDALENLARVKASIFERLSNSKRPVEDDDKENGDEG